MATYKGFDIDKLSETLNEKVDLDLSNIQPLNSAKGRIASWSFPTSREEIQLQESGYEYTATDNGYVYVAMDRIDNNCGLVVKAIGTLTMKGTTTPNSNTNMLVAFVPIKAGQKYVIEYFGQTTISAYFVHVSGEATVDSGSSIDAATIRQMIATQIASGWNDAFPVGSLYFGETSTCPIATLIPGSTWTLVSSGRVIQGSDGSHSAGTTIEPGLPNITGRVGYSRNLASSSGAFTTTNVSEPEVAGSGSNATQIRKIDFSAKRSNAIYGNSDTVQPPAYVVNIWKRTA